MAIASRSVQCLRHFERLAEEAQNSEGEPPLSASAVGDELGRFKIWAGNIGAFQRDSRSLDYRLREASQVGDQVTKILEDLDFSLQECTEIVSGRRAQKHGNLSDGEAFKDDFSDISDSDGSEDPSSSGSGQEPVSELSQLFLAITEAVTSLYKLSITIRNPTPRDRYAKAASSTPFDVSYDVGHVYEKFPHIRSKAWLMDRLGRAVTRRREFLRYREKHREKIGGNIRPSTDLDERHEQADNRRNVTYNDAQTPAGDPTIGLEASFVSRSQFASTKATTYVANLNDESLDKLSAVGRSETSYVTSIAEENSGKLRQIPNPPKESANGMPFECPYCFTIQSVRNSKYWRKHLLSDLKPYICTFEHCSAHLFDRRQMWFQHEMDKHRKEWRCKFCSCELFASAASLESHLQDQHSEYTQQQTLSLVALCEQIPENVAASACPFCDWDASLREQTVSKEDETKGTLTKSNILAVSLEKFQRHVGDHLEQLALFAIPPPMEESSGVSSNRAAASHNSDHTPGSYIVSEISSLSSALADHGNPAFGLPLAEAVKYCGPRGVDVCLPAVVYRCLEFLKFKDSANTENLFLISGSGVEIQELKKGFNTEGDLDLLNSKRPYDIHVVASLLKVYLCELPDYIGTGFDALDLGEISRSSVDKERNKVVAAYNIIVHKLPKASYTLLRALFAFVTSIPETSEINETNRRNAGTAFTSILHIPTRASELFLDDFDAIFNQISDEETQKTDVTGLGPLTDTGLPTDAGPKSDVDLIEILSIIVSLQTLQSLGKTILESLRVFGEATWEPWMVYSAISKIDALLMALQNAATGEKIPWYSTLQELNVPNGPIHQLHTVLELLESRLKRQPGLKSLGEPKPWPFPTEEAEMILGILLHVEGLFKLAQQNDSALLSQAIKGDEGASGPPARPVADVSELTVPPPVDALAPSFKGGMDSGAAPKMTFLDLTWALEYIIRGGEFWFRDLDKRLDIITEEPKAV